MIRAANIAEGSDGFEWMGEVDVQIMFRPLSGGRVAVYRLTDFDEIKARVGQDTNKNAITWPNVEQIKESAAVYSEAELECLV